MCMFCDALKKRIKEEKWKQYCEYCKEINVLRSKYGQYEQRMAKPNIPHHLEWEKNYKEDKEELEEICAHLINELFDKFISK